MTFPALTEALGETLSVFESTGGPGEPLTTQEVTDRLDVSRRSCYDRLTRLSERGRLETKKVGARGRVWWQPPAPAVVDGQRPSESGTEPRPVDVAEGTKAGDAERQAIGARREQFRALVDATEEYAIFMLDPAGHVRTWNPGAERIKGYEEADILGEHFSTFYTEEDREAGVPAENLAAATRDGKTEDEGWRVTKRGTRFWANVTISAIRDAAGELQGYAKVTRDMTERHEYERQLREERDFVRSVLDAAPASIFAVDDEGTVTRGNDRFSDKLGIEDPAADVSVGDIDLYDESGELVPPDERPYRRVFETGEPVTDWRCQVELPSGDRRWLSINVAPNREADDGSLEDAVVTAQDVTQLTEQAKRLERQRDDVESELDAVMERVDDAVLALDDDWRFTYVNEQTAGILDREPAELIGATFWEIFPESPDSEIQAAFERAVDTQESVTRTTYSASLSTWFEITAYPDGDSLSVYFRDVTDRETRKRELERYETVVETMSDGVFVVDDGQFTMVNQRFAEMVGANRGDVLGASTAAFVDEETRSRIRSVVEELKAGDRDAGRFERALPGENGGLPVEATITLVDDRDPVELVGVVRDVSDRKAREEELELYETIVDTVDDGVYVLDSEQRFTKVNDAYVELTGYDRDELLGSHASLVVDQAVATRADALNRQMAEGAVGAGTIEADVHRKDGTTVRAESRFTPLPNDDSENPGKIGVVRDVSERVERERELERRVRQQAVVTELGQRALEGHDLDGLMAEAAERVAETLDTDYCKVLDLDSAADVLHLRQGVGWRDGFVGEATVSATEHDSQAAHTLRTDEPVVVENLATETRFSGPDLLRSHDVSSGISTIIGSVDDPHGILGAHDTAERTYSDHDVAFVRSVANILATAIERHEYETELLRQRERLDALNNLNGVVRNVTEAAIEKSTREEIEQVVCEALAGSDSYSFAWIGEVDPTTETVEQRTEAGVEGYLDDVTISVDPDDSRSEGATGRALRTGTVQTTRDVFDDDRYDQWREQVEEYGFRSSAAIPVVHEGTTFGVLNVYAARPDAFEGEEREVVAQLGEVLGHAIAAVERKRALMSDEVVELEFRITDLFDSLDLDTAPVGQIELGETVPIRDDEYLVYGTATDDAVDTLTAIVDSLEHWVDVTVSEGEDVRSFELRLSEPPVLSTVASLGGTVDEAIIADGDYRMTIHLSPSADVRTLIDVVHDAYPTADLLRRKQLTRRSDAGERVTGVLEEGLTERQRTALRAAYHADFFAWPRETTGEALAESLDVSPPTFHQHLRKAERKVFESLLTEGDVAEPST